MNYRSKAIIFSNFDILQWLQISENWVILNSHYKMTSLFVCGGSFTSGQLVKGSFQTDKMTKQVIRIKGV